MRRSGFASTFTVPGRTVRGRPKAEHRAEAEDRLVAGLEAGRRAEGNSAEKRRSCGGSPAASVSSACPAPGSPAHPSQLASGSLSGAYRRAAGSVSSGPVPRRAGRFGSACRLQLPLARCPARISRVRPGRTRVCPSSGSRPHHRPRRAGLCPSPGRSPASWCQRPAIAAKPPAGPVVAKPPAPGVEVRPPATAPGMAKPAVPGD